MLYFHTVDYKACLQFLATLTACAGLNSYHKGQVYIVSANQLFVYVITMRFSLH